MRYTLSISFPRSGHHLVKNLIDKYFNGQLHYCEYYLHCRKLPCSDPKTNFQKIHDLHLNTNVSEKMPLLIQYRKDPVKCLISWYKLEVAYDRIPEQIDEWHKFAEQRVKYLIKWFNKWVCKEYKNSLYVEYDNFLSEPLKSMQLIIEHLSPGQNVDLRHLNKVVDEANISYKSNIQNFIFFDQQYVDQLRKNISESIDFHTIIPHSSRY